MRVDTTVTVKGTSATIHYSGGPKPTGGFWAGCGVAPKSRYRMSPCAKATCAKCLQMAAAQERRDRA